MKTNKSATRKIQSAAKKLEQARILMDDARAMLPVELRQWMTDAVVAIIKAESETQDAATLRTFEERYPEPKDADGYAAHDRMNDEQLAGLR